MFKKIKSYGRLFLIPLLFALLIVAGEADVAENAGAAFASDNIVTGKMDSYAKSFIVIDNVRYSFCEGMKIFNMIAEEISLREIETAIEVELYVNNGCVNKIIVLSFAY